MKREWSVKKRLIIGGIALAITGILTSCLLVEYQKDWIMFLAIIILATVFLKFALTANSYEAGDNKLYGRKQINWHIKKAPFWFESQRTPLRMQLFYGCFFLAIFLRAR